MPIMVILEQEKGTVNLYKKQELVARNVPETEAVQALIDLIKANGDWRENV